MSDSSASAQQSAFGVLLIGDELLSGKRSDKHQAKVIELLDVRGLELAWSLTVGDDPERLTDILRWTLDRGDVVFSFGGIGATPDDRTRQCAAAAAGVPTVIHPEGRAELEAVFGERTYPQRIEMVNWPEGATPIPNPVNRVPGFSFRGHHFVPGFPSMAWPMVEWVLDTRYAGETPVERQVEFRLEARDVAESDLIEAMNDVIAAHPDLRLSCLPNASGRRSIEFGLRGTPGNAATAYHRFSAHLDALGVVWVALTPPGACPDAGSRNIEA